MNNEPMPLIGKVILTVLAVIGIAAVFLTLGPMGGIGFLAFAAISILNHRPRSNARGRDEPGEF